MRTFILRIKNYCRYLAGRSWDYQQKITLCRYCVLLFSFLDIHFLFFVMLDKQEGWQLQLKKREMGAAYHSKIFLPGRLNLWLEVVAFVNHARRTPGFAKSDHSPIKASWRQSRPKRVVSASRKTQTSMTHMITLI